MQAQKSKQAKVVSSIAKLGGIEINGPNEWDIRVNDEKAFGRILRDSTLGLGESYMDKQWDCDRIDMMIAKILDSEIDKQIKESPRILLLLATAKILNLQSRFRAFEVGKKHYDIGNGLYEKMLDRRMAYSCGYWRNGAKTIDEAQEAKLELICQKLGLKKGMKLLDIGVGWGSLAKYAAEKYGVSVTGYTVSKEQAKLASERCKGLPVEIRCEDYRSLNDKFDRIVSVGMFEHVGYKNYPTYMKVTHRCLANDGIALLHTIGTNTSQYIGDAWSNKYIFPNGMVPSVQQIGAAMEGYFMLEDWHNFGEDYDKTLMAWHTNFQQAWPELSKTYSEKFKRMWEYYLLSFAGGFRSRRLQLWQIVMTKKGTKQPDCRKS